MPNNLERSYQVLENPGFNPEFIYGPKITEEERIALSEKMVKVRICATVRGVRFDYPEEIEELHGYLNEMKIPVAPEGELRAGADVLFDYSDNTTFAYLYFVSERGLARFVQYSPSPNILIPDYSFSVADMQERSEFRIEHESIYKMNKGVYDVVTEMADTLIASNQGAFLP